MGNEKHYWKNGKFAAFDTSILHSTQNLSDKARYVLMLRFWHPELTAAERDAFTYIFDFLDHAALGEEQLELFETMHLLMGKDKKSSSNTGALPLKKKGADIDDDIKPKKKAKTAAAQQSVSKGFGSKAK